METEKKLPKHLQAAVNSLTLQVAKFQKKHYEEIIKRGKAQTAIDDLDASISALRDQIKKLKGD